MEEQFNPATMDVKGTTNFICYRWSDINILPSFREAKIVLAKFRQRECLKWSKMVNLWKNQFYFHYINLENDRFTH